MKKFLIAMFIMVGLSISAFGTSCGSPELQGIVDGMKKNVPLQVDDVTTLTKVDCKGKNLEYIFDLNDADGIEFSKFTDKQMDMFKDMQTGILKNSYCANMAEPRKITDSIAWIYNFNGKKILEIELKDSDCK